MTVRPSSDRKAVVDTAAKWKPIDEATPRGRLCLVINRQAGSAKVGQVSTQEDYWTHWYPLPVFED